MYHDIRLPDDLYKRLEKHAKGFDTPITVIERILNEIEGVEEEPAQERPRRPFTPSGKKDTTKYKFNGKIYGKSRLVQAVVTDVCNSHQNTTFDSLEEVFPPTLQGSIGVIARYDDAKDILERTGHARHYLKDDDLIELRDGTLVAVSNQWGAGNIHNFLRNVHDQGYEIEEV